MQNQSHFSWSLLMTVGVVWKYGRGWRGCGSPPLTEGEGALFQGFWLGFGCHSRAPRLIRCCLKWLHWRCDKIKHFPPGVMCASRCETAQEKWGHFYHFSSLFQMEVGRKKSKAIYTSKKKLPKNLLKYWSELGLDLLAFLLLHPEMFILPYSPSQWGNVGQSLQSSNAASNRRKNKSLLLPCCLTGVFPEQETEWVPMCQWQKVLRALLGKGLGPRE